MEQSEALQILGLSATATHQDARSSWRVLAKTHHPDVGGSEISMARINQALETILDMQEPVVEKKQYDSHIRRDVSSFTVEVLPVVCWNALEVVAAHCGPIIVDDPPYMIEFSLHDTHLNHSLQAWCRCELVPEAGATTVHLTVGSTRASETPDVEEVRDLLVGTLNSIDWHDD